MDLLKLQTGQFGGGIDAVDKIFNCGNLRDALPLVDGKISEKYANVLSNYVPLTDRHNPTRSFVMLPDIFTAATFVKFSKSQQDAALRTYGLK